MDRQTFISVTERYRRWIDEIEKAGFHQRGRTDSRPSGNGRRNAADAVGRNQYGKQLTVR